MCNVENHYDITAGSQRFGVNCFQEQFSPQPYYLTNYMFAGVRADLMTVEQTGVWIKTLSHSKGWEEANQYSRSFQWNGICGRLLGKLTPESMKSELGIINYGHRIVIKAAIDCLYHDLPREVGKTENWSINENRTEAVQSTKSEGANTKYELSPVPNKTTHQDVASFSVSESAAQNRMVEVASSPKLVLPTSKNNEVLKNIGKQSSPSTKKDDSSTICKLKADEWQTSEPNDAEVLSFSVRKKSVRARPDNPLKYKVLRDGKLRFGKSVRSDFIKFISKGSVVVINQIKGRSGRVVVPQPDGSFTKVGWVTLYTHDRQQLLEKLNFKHCKEMTKHAVSKLHQQVRN